MEGLENNVMSKLCSYGTILIKQDMQVKSQHAEVVTELRSSFL